MKGNGIDLFPAVRFQGWEIFFNHLQGPIFFNLVREFLTHANSSMFQVTFFMFGKKIVIFEKLIAKLIGHDGSGIRCEKMVEKESNLDKLSEVIFTTRKNSRKIKDLHPHLKVWDRIILRCINPRPVTNSSYYINGDQQYILYNIGTRKKVNLPALLFQNLRDTIRDTKDGSCHTPNFSIPLSFFWEFWFVNHLHIH